MINLESLNRIVASLLVVQVQLFKLQIDIINHKYVFYGGHIVIFLIMLIQQVLVRSPWPNFGKKLFIFWQYYLVGQV